MKKRIVTVLFAVLAILSLMFSVGGATETEKKAKIRKNCFEAAMEREIEAKKAAEAFEMCGEAALKFDDDETYDYAQDGCTLLEIVYALRHINTECE